MSMKLWRFVCIALLILAGSAYWAQETEEDTSNESQTKTSESESKESTNDKAETEETTETEKPSAGETETKTSEDTPDVFDPTENISEDYAVPFPVDI